MADPLVNGPFPTAPATVGNPLQPAVATAELQLPKGTTVTPGEVIDALARECYRIAAEHGFHLTPNPIPQSLCLIHSEVSEALEAYRDDDIALRYDERGKPEGLMVELADALIRILDTAHEIAPGQLGEALVAKMAYNETRIPGHGRVRL